MDTTQYSAIDILTDSFNSLTNIIESLCPDSREKNIAIVNLTKSKIWAIDSIKMHDEDNELNTMHCTVTKDK